MAPCHMSGQSPARLVRAVAVTAQTMSVIFAKLSGDGLISRTPSPLHSRVPVNELTPGREPGPAGPP